MQDSDPVSLEECDVRIAHLQAETLRLKSLRNSYSPISRLPTEVLCKIFICVRNASEHAYGRPVIPPYVKTTTHVCRHWRITAIDFPELWSQITFDVPLKWAKLQLQRAKKSPLDFIWEENTSHNASKLGPMLRSCSKQLRELYIIGAKRRDIEQYGIDLRGVVVPFLEHLQIMLSDRSNWKKAHHLPADLFANGTPSLRHLWLRGVVLPFTSPVFQGLCSLTLKTLDFSTVSLPKFLDALDRSPGLEKLKVDFKFSEHLRYTPRPQAVTLPKIKSFQLNATMSNCTAIVKHLMLPISAKIKITILKSDPLVNNTPLAMHEEFCAAIQQAWLSNPLQTGNESVLPSIHSMEYTSNDSDNANFSLGFWLDVLTRDFDKFSDPNETQAALEIMAAGCYRTQSSYLVKHLPIENVTSVIINGSSLLEQRVWTRLSGLSSLAYLSLGANSANSFFSKALSGSASAAVTCFPHLTHISFYEVDFGLAQYGDCLECIDPEAHPVHFDKSLLRFLRLRKKHNTSIQKLRFESCTNFNEESFEAVTKLVGDVDWDGEVEIKSSLIPVPRRIGEFPAGSVVASGNGIPKGWGSTNIEVHVSLDKGKTWRFVSQVAKGTSPNTNNGAHPIWEPFLLSYKGQLGVFYSDQRDPLHGQKLAHQKSTDLKTWGPITNDVAFSNYTERPGMTTIAQFKQNGKDKFIITYEVGLKNGPVEYAVGYRISDSPFTFDSAVDHELVATDGTVVSAGPYVVWTPAGGRDGTLVVSDSTYREVFTNARGGEEGAWVRREVAADQGVAYTRSLTVLPGSEGRKVLFVNGGYYGLKAANVTAGEWIVPGPGKPDEKCVPGA